ncbi:MAG: response regulator [Chitinivibrionales bacterium]|nr:response regulator [Chitinivibrionales bacterium]MBD3356848.1 response regulator [Chitinivibrionales bacterium]
MAGDVVIIEDEEAIGFALTIVLAHNGIAAAVANSGKEGLALAFKEHPGLVLVDVRLPDMEGWDICRRLKEGEAGWVPAVMFLTAAAQESDRKRSAEAGADAFIAKPFEMNQLVAEVKRLLGIPLSV